MALDRSDFQEQALSYRPGNYTTRVFEPVLSFTRSEVFQSFGENTLIASLDERPTCAGLECFQSAAALSPGLVVQIESALGDNPEWAKSLTESSVELWGYSGTQIDFETDTCTTAASCSVAVEGLNFWGYFSFTRVRMLIIDVPGGRIGFDIEAHQSRFDRYWTEVAEPILASIEFLDG
jgi:hypothetical protein